ncbi:hypothetical protein Hypma_006197 [Hypsizygus marmoreus]|uniref:Uncharacterized protein n=1 Tax=Hypsizygus marmoreus TaxID=39966 RepID=A0A369JUW9_HYPMA|nr:hypothetical protein Hypma_006197 [Hypsizygus marmoreus]
MVSTNLHLQILRSNFVMLRKRLEPLEDVLLHVVEGRPLATECDIRFRIPTFSFPPLPAKPEDEDDRLTPHLPPLIVYTTRPVRVYCVRDNYPYIPGNQYTY